jgi:hypothetical protein
LVDDLIDVKGFLGHSCLSLRCHFDFLACPRN